MSTTQHNTTRDIALTGASLTGLSSPLDGLAGTLQVAFAVLRRQPHPSSLGRSLQSALRLEGGAAAAAAGAAAAAAAFAAGAAAATGVESTRSVARQPILWY